MQIPRSAPVDLNATQARLGLTRAALARAMGVHYQTLTKWQRGEQRPPAVARQMARALEWLAERGTLNDFLDHVDERRKDDGT